MVVLLLGRLAQATRLVHVLETLAVLITAYPKAEVIVLFPVHNHYLSSVDVLEVFPRVFQSSGQKVAVERAL